MPVPYFVDVSAAVVYLWNATVVPEQENIISCASNYLLSARWSVSNSCTNEQLVIAVRSLLERYSRLSESCTPLPQAASRWQIGSFRSLCILSPCWEDIHCVISIAGSNHRSNAQWSAMLQRIQSLIVPCIGSSRRCSHASNPSIPHSRHLRNTQLAIALFLKAFELIIYLNSSKKSTSLRKY